ncbi:MAG: prepilin-type N-terminal cleavage/methylation domain-containing protein [Burkholderiales bacterium]
MSVQIEPVRQLAWRGFTLIEVPVTLSVPAVLAGLAAPQLEAPLWGSRLGSVAAVDWSAPLCSEDSCAVVDLGAKTGAPAFDGVALQPRHQVDAFDVSTSGSGEPVPLFRITARGYGGTADTVSELQEVYRPCR